MKCFECGGRIINREITAVFYRKDRTPVFFEDVPVGECVQCGEKYLSGSTAERISDVLKSKRLSARKRVSVPVVSLAA